MGTQGSQALDLFHSDDLIGLGMEADAVRRRLHPEGVVTYLLDQVIRCEDFSPEDPSFEAIDATVSASITDALAMGGSTVRITASSSPQRAIEWYERLLQSVRRSFPHLWLHCFSAPEILAVAGASHLPLGDTLARLRDAGLDSIPGDGASLLDPCPALTCTPEDWLRVHRTAHQLGIPTAAAMVFGAGESFEQRLDFLEKLHRLQDETGGFTAFTPICFQPRVNAARDQPTAVEYLKMLAISRLCLDNIPNIQSSQSPQGPKVLQMGLRFGGNDAGSVTPQNNAAQSTGEEDLRRIIRDAGFRPVQRDTLYRTMFLN